MIRILIRSLSALSRRGLEQMLGSEPGFLLLADSHTGKGVTGEDEENPPDVAIVEVEADDDSDIDIRSEDVSVGSRTILLVDRPGPAWISRALRSGVRGILSNSSTGEQVIAAVRAVAHGLVILHPEELRIALPDRRSGAVRETLQEPLTPRETDVLRHIADGLSNKEIADRLAISEHTVKFHVASIMSKLDATSRTEAVTAAIRLGLLMI